jgi:hypothetical protein
LEEKRRSLSFGDFAPSFQLSLPVHPVWRV